MFLQKNDVQLQEDFQVYRSSAQKKKMKRLQKLKANDNRRGIRAAKLKIKTRFVLTKVESDTKEEEIELELLD